MSARMLPAAARRLARSLRAGALLGALLACVPGALLACVLAPASSASAQADTSARAEARVHFDRGIELFNEGRYDAALAELQRAYDVSPAFPVLYNLGRVHTELGHPVQAAEAYERYLAEGGDAIPRARRREVEVELARQRDRIGRLSVETNVAGSTVSVDGVDVATTPLSAPIPLGAGAHTIGVRAPGHAAVVRSVQIAGGVEETVRVELAREIEARGSVRVTSSLPDVVVRIDGAEVGRTPIDATIPVSAGDHEISASRPGYLTDTRRVRVDDQADLEVRLRMDPDPSPAPDDVGVLALRTPAVSYALRIDGAERSALSELRLPIGAHVVEIEAAERQPWRGAVRIEPGRSLVLAPPLEWTPDARSARVGAASSQRAAGQGLSIGGGVLLAAAVPLLIWNESEIVSTDARGVQLAQSERDCIDMGLVGTPMCDAVRAELEQIPGRQGTQDILRAVSIAGTIVGAISATVGVVLWATAASEEEIDRAAHATLRLGPGGLHLSGEWL